MGRKTRIRIDYSVCGDGNKIDPRSCGACLRSCPPAVFLLHQTFGIKEKNPFDPVHWRITPLWTSLCTRCMKCVLACPERAIRVEPADISKLVLMENKRMKKTEMPQKEGFVKCLVIGGAGMLGYEIACQLLAEHKEVRVLDLKPVADKRIESMVGDIRNNAHVRKACRGMDVVFQTAAAVWDPKTPQHVFEEVNVIGNRLVIDACREFGVTRLVYTSTMDVVVRGRRPIVYGDESLPYPEKLPADAYSRTKILAERMVLGANSPDLLTCALRPVGMYGPRDKYHVPSFINLAKGGMNIRLGSGKACFSHVYSENAAYAHLLAAKRLFPGSPVPGNAYFICDYQPASNIFDFMAPFIEALNLKPPKRSIPYALAYPLSWVMEKLAPTSNFNRFSVVQTCVDHTFRDNKARRDLGYEPIVSKEEAFKRTLAWLKTQELSRGKPDAASYPDDLGLLA